MSTTHSQSSPNRKNNSSNPSGKSPEHLGKSSKWPNESQKPPIKGHVSKNGQEAPPESFGANSRRDSASPRSPEPRRRQLSSPASGKLEDYGDNPPSSNSSPGRSENRKSKNSSPSTGSANPKESTGSGRMSGTQAQPATPPKSDVLTRPNLSNTTDDRNEMILAYHLKQLSYSNTSLVCYTFAVRDMGDGADAKKIAIEAFAKEVLSKAQSCIFTDYQQYVLSPYDLPVAIAKGTHVGETTTNQGTKAIVGLKHLKTIQWHDVLKFLETASLPKRQPDELPDARNAVLAMINVLATPPYGSRATPNRKEASLTFLDVRSQDAVAKPLGQMDQTDLFSRQPLADLINNYRSRVSNSVRGLETYLKGRRVQIRQNIDNGGQYGGNQDGGSQQKPRTKMTIVGLARPDDGRDSQDPHPNVRIYGGNSHEVEFYYNSNTKSRDGSHTPAGSSPGRYVTVAEYFRIKKGVEPESLVLPLVNVGTRRKPTYLPPELYDVLEPRKGTTSQFTRSDLVDITAVLDVQKFLENCGKKHNYRLPGLKVLPGIDGAAYPIGIMAGTVLAPCRLLQSPSIEYHDRKVVDTRFGAWKMNSRAIEKAKAKAHQLVVLRIGIGSIPGTVENEITKTQDVLRKRLSEHGINLSLDLSAKPIAVQGFENAIEDEITKAGKQKKFTAVLVVLPDNKRPLYDGVKRQLDRKLGLQNICVVASSFSTGKPIKKSPVNDNAKDGTTKEDVEELNGLFSQIALKLNLKAGGRNQVLAKRNLKSIKLESTMIVGFETIAPPKKAHGGAKAIAAIVASEDEHLSQWPAGMTILGEKSIDAELAGLLLKRMETWKGNNGSNGHKYPKNIIIYYNNLDVKHGSAGTEKVESLQKAWEATYKEAKLDAHARPELMVIAVNKDHQAQLRTPSSIDKDRAAEKIPHETILVRTSGKDEDKAWEFVVQGHKPLKVNSPDTKLLELNASKATVPIRYTILENKVFLTAEAKAELENLTDNMRYLSACSTFAITDTLPIHYVELLSQRIQSYVRPWYYPTNRRAEMEDMSQNSIKVHDDVARTMFYV